MESVVLAIAYILTITYVAILTVKRNQNSVTDRQGLLLQL
jgi:hypothetical protein